MNKNVWLLFACQALMNAVMSGQTIMASLVGYKLSGTALNTLPMAIQMVAVMCASLVAGGLSGLLGVGGGPIKVPVMLIFMNVPLIVATATSNFMIGVTAAASAIVYYRRGDILVDIAAPLAVGVFLGSLLGARVAPRIRTKYVVYLLVAIMLYLAGHLTVHLFKGGSA